MVICDSRKELISTEPLFMTSEAYLGSGLLVNIVPITHDTGDLHLVYEY